MKTEKSIVKEMLEKLWADISFLSKQEINDLSENRLDMIEALYLYWKSKEKEQLDKGFITY